MKEDITWHIGLDEENGQLDKAAPKAYFHWHEDGKVIKTQAFTKLELLAEVKRLHQTESDSRIFEQALEEL